MMTSVIDGDSLQKEDLYLTDKHLMAQMNHTTYFKKC